MEMNKKGQAAMEFLMTYGWAILVVLIVIGTLAYFNVLNPANLLPNRCTFGTGFSCDEYVIQGDTGDAGMTFNENNANDVKLDFTNNMGRTIYVTEFEAYDQQHEITCTKEYNTPVIIKAGATESINAVDCKNAAGNDADLVSERGKLKLELTVRYTLKSGGETNIVKGEMLKEMIDVCERQSSKCS